MVHSAHVDDDGRVYAYVQCGGHVHRVGAEAFVELRDGSLVVDTKCTRLGLVRRKPAFRA